VQIDDLASWAFHPQSNRHVLLGKKLLEMGYDKNSSILDVGCGDAGLAVVLRKLGFNNISGIDWKDVGEIAYRDSLSAYAQVNLNDANQLHGFADDSKNFDIIVYSDVLEHLENPSIVLNMMSKLLPRTGVVICTIPNI